MQFIYLIIVLLKMLIEIPHNVFEVIGSIICRGLEFPVNIMIVRIDYKKKKKTRSE